MILSSSFRINQLIQQKNDYKHRLQAITMELQDLSAYGRNIADGRMSIGEILRTPTSMYNRNMAYMSAANYYGDIAANQQMMQLTQSPLYIAEMGKQNAAVQQNMANLMRERFKQAAVQQFAKYEASMLKEKETAMELEKETLKEEIAAIEEQLKSAKQERDQSTKEFFGSGNG